MKSVALPVFLDTSYVYALINTRDQWHERAVNWQRKIVAEQRMLLCTEQILFEIGDGLASIKFRAEAARIIRALESSSFVEVVAASKQLFSAALELYEQHQDKDWGMTDCASFVVMRGRGAHEALTVDEHFRQAGFRALLLEDK